MKRTKILAVLLLLLVAAAYASDMKTEICPICLFPHESGFHQTASPEAPTMYSPVTVPYATQSALETVHDDDLDLTLSVGTTSGRLSWVYWLDCMARCKGWTLVQEDGTVLLRIRGGSAAPS